MKLYALSLTVIFLLGCAFIPVFHNSANSELKSLSEALQDTLLEDLFRQYPTLKLVKSTDIGKGNTRHEFSYLIVEKEDTSERSSVHANYYVYERHSTFYINIFVNSEGVIYEILEPVLGESNTVPTYRRPSPHKITTITTEVKP